MNLEFRAGESYLNRLRYKGDRRDARPPIAGPGKEESEVPTPQDAGLCPERLEHAYTLVQEMVDNDRIVGGTLTVGGNGHLLEPRPFGRMGSPDAPPVQPETIFLIASPSKPITTLLKLIFILLALHHYQFSLEYQLEFHPKFSNLV